MHAMVKRIFTVIWWMIRWLVIALVLAFILADIMCEGYGLPESAVNFLRAKLADRGLALQAETVRLGFINGLVVDYARIRSGSAGMPLVVTWRHIQARPYYLECLRGHPTIRFAAVADLAVDLYPSGSIDGDKTSLLALRQANGNAYLRRDRSLALDLDGFLENIHVTIRADIRGLDRFKDIARRRAGSSGRVRPTPEQQAYYARVSRRLEEWQSLLERCRLTRRDASLSGALTLDLRAPEKVEFKGRFSLANILVQGVVVDKAKGTIHYADRQVDLDKLMVFLSRDEMFSGHLRLDLDKKNLGGTFQGLVRPASLNHMRERHPRSWVSQITFPTPVAFVAELLPSPFDPRRWRLRADLRAAHVNVQNLVLQNASAALWWDKGILALRCINISLPVAMEDEYLAGNMEWNTKTGTVTADALLHVRPLELLPRLGLILPRAWRKNLDIENPISLTFHLNPSPLDWHRWVASGSLSCTSVKFWDRSLGPLLGDVSIDKGKLLLKTSSGYGESPANALQMTARMDLARVASGRIPDIDFDVLGLGPKKAPADAAKIPAGPWTPALTLRGKTVFAKGRFRADAKGTLWPSRFYTTFRQHFRIHNDGIIAAIHCPGAPVEFTMNLLAGTGVKGFRLKADVKSKTIRYGDLTFEHFQSGLEFDPGGIRLLAAKAKTAAGDEVAVDLDIRFNPLQVTLVRSRIDGNPLLASAFIYSTTGRRIYRSIWKDFVWDPAHMPRIDIHSLVYQQIGAGLWQLKLDADIAGEKLHFGELKLNSLGAKVKLNLPGGITVEKARIHTETGGIEGHAEIVTGDVPKCAFEMKQTEGGLDPRHILHSINPAWDDWLKIFAFSPESVLSCRGSFYLSREPRLQLYGSVETPFFEFSGYRFDQVALDWQFKESRIFWNIEKGKLFDGDINVTGTYDTETRQGFLAMRAQGIKLHLLAKHMGAKATPETHKGLISAHCRLQFLRDWAGCATQISGEGRVALTQGDIWHVPLFRKLGKLLDFGLLSRLTKRWTSNLGAITSIKADLNFVGDRIAIRNLRTDGTLISLLGKGEYAWGSDRIYLAIKGRALRRVRIISLVFSPLAWVFNAELTGTAKNYKWRLVTPLQKAISKDASGYDVLDPDF